MADLANTAPKADATAGLGSLIAAPFRAIFNGLVALAEAGPRGRQLRKLSEMSDEQLAALGTTRADEVKRIFSGSLYV